MVVYDSDTGEPVGRLDDSDLRAVAITVTDQLLVGSLSGELTMYELDSLEPIQAFSGNRAFSSVPAERATAT